MIYYGHDFNLIFTHTHTQIWYKYEKFGDFP